MNTDHLRITQGLQARVTKQQAKLKSLKGEVEGISPGISLSDVPHWEVVRQEDGSFSPGDDWEGQFEDASRENRVVHRLQTHGGELAHLNCDDHVVRARLRFSSQGKGTVSLRLGHVGSGRVQIKANGILQEFTDKGWVSIELVAAPLLNEVTLMADGRGDRLQVSLDGLLFDGENRAWTKP